MDLTHPIEALIPGARGQILGALLRAGGELSTAEIGRLSSISGPQTSRVLVQLVELGIVERREVPPAVLYRPVDGNVVVKLLRELRDVRDVVLTHAASTAIEIAPPPVLLSVYGSVATGLPGPGSDIDVLAVRPDGADNDDRWVESLDHWRLGLERFAGLRVSVLEVDETEWRSLDRLGNSLWSEIDRDQVVLMRTTKVGAS